MVPLGGRQPEGPRAAAINALSAPEEEEKAHLQLLQHLAPGHPEAPFCIP